MALIDASRNPVSVKARRSDPLASSLDIGGRINHVDELDEIFVRMRVVKSAKQSGMKHILRVEVSGRNCFADIDLAYFATPALPVLPSMVARRSHYFNVSLGQRSSSDSPAATSSMCFDELSGDRVSQHVFAIRAIVIASVARPSSCWVLAGVPTLADMASRYVFESTRATHDEAAVI